MENSIQVRVVEIIAEQLSLRKNDIRLESRLIDDLGADSLDIVELIMEMEEEFDTEIPDEQIEGMKAVKDVVDYIANHVA